VLFCSLRSYELRSHHLHKQHYKKPVFFCDVSKNRRRFAGHQHFGKRNVEEHQNERDIVKNMKMLVGKRGHVSFQTWGCQLPNTGMLARTDTSR